MGEGRPRRCPTCGGPIGGAVRCAYCGTGLDDPLAHEEVREALEALIVGADTELREYLPVPSLLAAVVAVGAAAGALLVAWRLGWPLWIAIPCALLLLALGLAAAGAIADRGELRLFRSTIRPRIEGFRERHGLSREELVAAARRRLGRRSGGLVRFLDDLLEG